MFWLPMNATLPSTTTSLRWLRRSGRRSSPRHGRSGIMRRHWNPAASNRLPSLRYPGYLRDPSWSSSTRTTTPRRTARSSASKNGAVVWSHAMM